MKKKRYTDEQIGFVLRQAETGTPHLAKEGWPTARNRRPFAVNTAFTYLQSKFEAGRWAEMGIHENAIFFGVAMHG